MRRLMRALALLAALCLPAAPSCADEWARRYGGRGDERVCSAVAAGDGLFAVGYTCSTDGDLSMRTRQGQTGWAVRLNADGEILWNFCTAHVGRNVMGNPYAHSDGTFSCILRAEGEGSEWLRLDGEGKLLARIEVADGGALCPHDESAIAYDGIPYEQAGTAQLAVICEHADGTYCCARMSEAGEIAHGAVFSYGMDWVVRPLPDGSGRIAFAHTVDGGAQVLFVMPGSGEAPRVVPVPIPQGTLEWVLDAVAGQDGSVVFSGQLAKPAGVLIRISSEGDVLFSIETNDSLMLLTMTDTGFAGATSSQVLFYDEDGGLLSARDADELYLDHEMTALYGGVALMRNEPGAKTRQIAVRRLESGMDTGLDTAQEGVIFALPGGTLLAVQEEDDAIHLLIELEDGAQQRIAVEMSGAVAESDAELEAWQEGRFKLADGELVCEEVFGGALVTRLDAQGQPLWQTRTMIHTAADTLQWRCAAALSDGSILLGGRYLTGSNGKARQQAVTARLGADGVLREMKTAADLGCVCAIVAGKEEPLLLVSHGQWASDHAQTLARLDRLDDREAWTRLCLGLGQENAILLMGADGSVYAVGTHAKNGAQAVVFLRAEKAD